MRIRLSRSLEQAASALLVTMVLGGILCVFVIYYLSLIQQQNTLGVRSQAWNIAVAVCEAGIEEALQALNDARDPTATPPITLSTTEWSFDGTYYWRKNEDAALDGNWYRIRIDLRDQYFPEIIVRARVILPAVAANTPSTFFAAVGVTSLPADPHVISRTVRVVCKDSGLFVAAMVAKHKIDLRGNGILTDSFNSSSVWKSYFGQYKPGYHLLGDKGDVASNDGVVSTISVQNAHIYGKAHTGPEGSVAIGSLGGVGTHLWQATHTGFQDGYVLQDANFTFPKTGLPYDGSTGVPLGGPADIVLVTNRISRTMTNSPVYPNPAPWSGVMTTLLTTRTTSTTEPVPGTYVGSVTINLAGASTNSTEKTYTYDLITGTNYTYALYTTNTVYTTNHYDHVLYNSADYYTTDDLHGSTIVLGEARLVLPNGLAMSGNDQITIAPNASLKIYVDGTSCTIGGNGILNLAGYAEDFYLECTDSVKTFTFNGNGEFIGVLLAPEAHMDFNGGGHANNDFIGAVMMNSINMNGHFSFHYDEALIGKFPNPRLLVKSWDEINGASIAGL